jgi:3-oxoacyl-ACP reductase-like protein
MSQTAQAQFPSVAQPVPSAPGVADIQVDPSKLLDVAKIVEDQANALQDKLRLSLGQLHIDTPSSDTISTVSVDSWNALISDDEQSYAKRVLAYVEGLRALVQQLRVASGTYSLSEEDKAAHFEDRSGSLG